MPIPHLPPGHGAPPAVYRERMQRRDKPAVENDTRTPPPVHQDTYVRQRPTGWTNE